ncbi:MAG: MASE3 domain-containing protein [Candidatus Methanoperedens sp.]
MVEVQGKTYNYIGDMLRRLRTSPRAILTLVFLLSLSLFLMVGLLQQTLYRRFDAATYLVFHNIAEFFSIIVSLSIFSVGWYTYSQSKNKHSLFLSCSFLVIGLIDFMHMLSFPGMPDFITPSSTNKGILFWISARLFSAAAFLASAYIYAYAKNRFLSKYSLLASSFTIVALVFAGAIYYPSYIPPMFIEGAGLTNLKIYLEYVTIGLFTAAFFVYLKLHLKTGNTVHILFLSALIISVFSELAFTLYKSAFDTYNLLGHIYKIAAFYLIYYGVFIESVQRPYVKLKKTGEELHKVSNAIEQSADIVIITDKNGNIEYVNPAFEKVTGYAREEAIGKNPRILKSGKQDARFYRVLWETILSGVAFHGELINRRKNGELYYAEKTITPVKDPQGNITHFVSTDKDITERKKAEEERERLSRHNKKIFDSVGEGIYGVDMEGKTTFINPAAASMLGYEAEELIGKPAHEAMHHTKQDGTPYPKEECPTCAVLQTGAAHSVVDEVFWKKDGTSFPVEYTCTPLRERGEIAGAVVVFRDVTERKRAVEMRLEKERLEYASKAKSEFLASMSHELRTPLNAVMGFSQILNDGTAGELNEKQKRFVDNINKAGDFLLNLINDILDLSKVEAGKIELAPEKMSVPVTIKETLSLIKEKAMKHNVLLKTEFDPELEFMEADKQRFKQILFNLLSNAVKFSKEEGGAVTIIAKKEGDMAQISVSDTGIGIREENVGKLFQKFEQLESGISQKYGGTGLGLAITKQLVELHGGKIRAESRYGEGSTFTFLLPIVAKKEME